MSKQPHTSDRLLEGIFTFASVWFISGLFIDGWAHNHLSQELETFFTPWHAIFYSGYFACAFTLLGWTLLRKKHVRTWAEALPPGYAWSIIGVGLFFIAGLGDMAWHEIFGVEADIDALLSPTHLLLATGGTLIGSGPLCSALKRWPMGTTVGWKKGYPMLVSMTATLGLITFMTQFAHYTDMDMAGPKPLDGYAAYAEQAIPLLGTIIMSALLAGIFLITLRKYTLPIGSATFVLTILLYALGVMRNGSYLLPSTLIAGILTDAYLYGSRNWKRTTRLRVFGFLFPALFQTVTMIFLVRYGTWWSVHMWTGSIFLAGISGLLISFVATED